VRARARVIGPAPASARDQLPREALPRRAVVAAAATRSDGGGGGLPTGGAAVMVPGRTPPAMRISDASGAMGGAGSGAAAAVGTTAPSRNATRT
jgi:hypothetical protein